MKNNNRAIIISIMMGILISVLSVSIIRPLIRMNPKIAFLVPIFGIALIYLNYKLFSPKVYDKTISFFAITLAICSFFLKFLIDG